MKFWRSIHWRIQAWHSLVLAGVVAGLLLAFYHFEQRDRFRRLDERLQSTLILAMPGLIPPPADGSGPPIEPAGAADPGAELLRGRRSPSQRERERRYLDHLEQTDTYYALYRPDGTVARRSANAPADLGAVSRHLRPGANEWRSRGPARELIHHGPEGVAMLVGTSSESVRVGLHALALKLMLLGASIVAVGMLGGGWMVGRAMRPVKKISEAAEKMAAGDLATRIPASGGAAELQTLAAVLNGSFDRLDAYYKNQARFTVEVSHELSVPVSVVLAQTQLALERPRTPREYHEALQACRRAAQRMQTVTRELLELAGYESGQAAGEREACDLADLAREAVAAMEILIAEKKARVVERLEPAPARVNVDGLSRVLINLIGNALRHNAEGVTITLRSGRDGEEVFLEVADDGAGIAAEHLPRLFERFYRAGSDRGGSGLGLAITRAIVEAHGGTITVESAPGEGTRFVLRGFSAVQRPQD